MSQHARFRRLVHSDQEPISTLVREVQDFGFSVVHDVLKPETCRVLAALVESEIVKSPEERPFKSIVDRKHRYDTPFHVEGVPRETLVEACRHPKLGELLSALVTPEGTLVELSALTSEPGAEAQRLHADTPYSLGDALLLCVFIALDDIDLDMGPLEVIMQSSRDRPVKEDSVVFPMTVARGDAVLMDSTAIHRASANTSQNKKRPVFYFSFQSPHGTIPTRETYSIQMSDGEAVSLAQLL